MNRQEYESLRAIFEREGRNTAMSIANVLKGFYHVDGDVMIASAYVLYKASNENIDVNNIESFVASSGCDKNRKEFLEASLDDLWQMVVGQRYRYSLPALQSIILFYPVREDFLGEEVTTPASITKLACALFDFDDTAVVADMGVGTGSFITEAFLSNPGLSFYGVDTNASIKEIASIKLEILGCNAIVEHGNMLDLDTKTHHYKYVFSNYPFGFKIRDLGFERNKILQKILNTSSDFSRGTTSDWLFNAAIVECLDDNGKGIAIMTNGSTWNMLDKSARKHFIDNGLIEAVISLPERVFGYMNIPTTMIVLSKNNNGVILVDATDMCEKGRRFNSFADEHIKAIVDATKNEGTNSRRMSIKEIASNDYVINPTRYLTGNIVIENGVPFEIFIKSIKRGAPIKADDLDKLVSKEPTDYQYLMLANIQKGQIDSELPYIKGIDENQKKYCIKNHSLILSKNGAPFKIAVAEVAPGKTILANGNLFIIEIDEDKASPYFIKAFLESEKGMALLKSITVGATIPSIGVESLKRILIPDVPITEQKIFVEKYQAKMDEILLYQRKLQKAIEELSHFYDDRGNDDAIR